MSLFVVDVESDGPAPGLHSMVCFAAVKIDGELKTTFKGYCAPISEIFVPEALAVSGFSREQHLGFEAPQDCMERFAKWLAESNKGKMTLLSDNPAFDFSFVNYYMHRFCGDNPFGHSARRIGDFCAGLHKDWSASSEFKKLRVSPHTHDPLDDARGNAEAFVALCRQFGVKAPGVDLKAPARRERPAG